jgi:hypothetical protein
MSINPLQNKPLHGVLYPERKTASASEVLIVPKVGKLTGNTLLEP